MSELISIIVPVYNVKQYLEKCVLSLVNQTYPHIEIILVNDGSKDGSAVICDELANKFNQVRVIHKENGGLSSARNKGIEESNGEYLMFIDSDDFVNIHMVEYMLHYLKQHQADFCACDFLKFYEGEEIDNTIAYSDIHCRVYEGEQILHQLFLEDNVQTVIACNKLYKKSLFSELRYAHGRLHEDEFIIHHILEKCKKTCYIDSKLLLYLQRDNSITHNLYNIRRLDVLRALYERMIHFKGTVFEQKATWIFLKILIKHYYYVKNQLGRKDIYMQLRKTFFQYNKGLNSIHWKYKIRFAIFSVSPTLYWNLIEKRYQ